MTRKTVAQKHEEPSKILMLAPIAIVLMVYSFMFFTPQQSAIRSAQERFESLSASHHEIEHGITDTRIQSAKLRSELRDIEAQFETSQRERSELVALRQQMRAQLESPSRPAATMERVTRLMEGHRLQVLESQPDAGQFKQAEKAVQPIRDLLADREASGARKNASQSEREVYELKVRGRFQDLQSALRSLSTELKQVLPLSLQMESLELQSTEARQSDRIWTLTILV